MHVWVFKYTRRFSDTPPFQEQSLIFLPQVWAALSDLLLTSRIKRGDDSLGVQSGNTAVLSCLLSPGSLTL